MPTIEERLAHVEKFLNDNSLFEPIPDPVYVQVVLDESIGRSSWVKPYTYIDATVQGLKVGDRVVVPVGGAYNRQQKDATVIRVCGQTNPYPQGEVKTVAGVL